MLLAIDRGHVEAFGSTEEVVAVSHAFPLALAKPGERIRIARLLGGRGMALRLTELGLNVGTDVRVAHRHGGQMVVVRGETRLALGAGLTHRILVTPVGVETDERRAS
jgi:ferrous iron transport protein A